MPNETAPAALYPTYELIRAPYYREQAVQYANYWAYRRNPNYYSFDQLGGDCTNFVSQAIYYAAGVMNYTPTYGWYYISLNNRSPSWTGVPYFWDFFTTNKGPGPFGHEVELRQVQPGDVIQMAIKDPDTFGHTVLVTDLLSENPDPDSIIIAAHDRDSAFRPISTYSYHMIRALHIDGVRYLSVGTDQRTSSGSENTSSPQPQAPSEQSETSNEEITSQQQQSSTTPAESYQEPPAVG